ncbi:hypothetical protein [Methylobacterium sp. E-045]|uniref:hypothetical protein n=1 Tax=Methylobacterium sp. E-045 TaxID=2836575 RepID=UPI001FBAD7A1|nr:hypothetical protein [Methylobacterium sp. E-045]MCJ2127574.1 hypothetical protein [Methylobacterium sp. E-045]
MIDAVARGDTGPVYNWLMSLVPLQGISDAIAFGYAERHGRATWVAVCASLNASPSCPRLASYWAFADCRYRKAAATCAEARHRPACPLPTLPLRKGGLNQAAYSLALFIRDVCGGDFIGWIDRRLAQGDPGIGSPNRSQMMRAAVLAPLTSIVGISDKLWSMMLAELLLAADPNRERWVTTGASMIAIDSLVHNFLHRSGALQRFGALHDYGPACYAAGGCANIIEGLTECIDAREFNPSFPATFPRFVQLAIWLWCAEWGVNLCNGRKINHADRCRQVYCPAYGLCDRLPLYGST